MRLVTSVSGPPHGWTHSGPATPGEVLELVRREIALTRGAIGRVTGLSRTAVTARLSALFDSGLLSEGPAEPRAEGAGRPPVHLQVNPAAGVVLAGAIGRSRTQAGVCDLGGEVLATADLSQEPGIGPDELMPLLTSTFAALLAEVGRPSDLVMAVGLTLPGTVDFTRGVSLDSPIMPGWNDVPLAPYLGSYLNGPPDVPLVVDNDVNGLAISEQNGHLEQFRDLILIKASTGVGAGIVAEGRLLRGSLGAAGEIGHTKSRHADGLPCRCGATGCLETVSSGWALVQTMQDQGYEVQHVRDVVTRAAEGDPVARQLVRESGRRIGEVTAAAINLLNPEAIVIGGDMSGVYETFVAGFRESVYADAAALSTRQLAIVPATHGDRSGVVGCANLALEAVLSPAAVDRRLSYR